MVSVRGSLLRATPCQDTSALLQLWIFGAISVKLTVCEKHTGSLACDTLRLCSSPRHEAWIGQVGLTVVYGYHGQADLDWGANRVPESLVVVSTASHARLDHSPHQCTLMVEVPT